MKSNRAVLFFICLLLLISLSACSFFAPESWPDDILSEFWDELNWFEVIIMGLLFIVLILILLPEAVLAWIIESIVIPIIGAIGAFISFIWELLILLWVRLLVPLWRWVWTRSGPFFMRIWERIFPYIKKFGEWLKLRWKRIEGPALWAILVSFFSWMFAGDDDLVLSCGSTIPIGPVIKTEDNYEFDGPWGETAAQVQAAAKQNAIDDAKAAVRKSIESQIDNIECASGCSKTFTIDSITIVGQATVLKVGPRTYKGTATASGTATVVCN